MYRKTTPEEKKILKNLKSNHRNNKRLLKTLQYFKPRNALLLSPANTAFTVFLDQLQSPLHTDISELKSIDCIWLNADDSLDIKTLFDPLTSVTHENTLGIVNNIYKNKKSQLQWQKIKAYPQTTVTIDTYHFGLIFFRKTQAREHFTLRT
jgi:hypothetical protein